MLHHVDQSKLPFYFEKIHRLLHPGGVSFHLGITLPADNTSQRGPDYARRYFMPDYHVVPVSTLLHHAENAGFEIVDVENLREHYKLTAQQWLKRLEDKHEQISEITDEVTYRVWRLSLALMVYGFQTGLLNLYHMILNKSDHSKNNLPLTRSDWYITNENSV